jgi:hypothetical protein
MKLKHFAYTHILFILGLISFHPGTVSIFNDFLIFLLIIQPVGSLIIHQHFNHNYLGFKNEFIEWFAILFLTTFGFWKFKDLKSYHICHHTTWLSDKDPTASEIAQGKLRYYLGITKPTAIPQIQTQENAKITWANENFYIIKGLMYVLIWSLFGIETLWHMVFAQQFFGYVMAKVHDICFHSNSTVKDKPWLFPIYFNDAWHIEHHKEFESQSPWHWSWINLQYWYSKILFKQ